MCSVFYIFFSPPPDETKEALSWKDRVQIAVDAAQGEENRLTN